MYVQIYYACLNRGEGGYDQREMFYYGNVLLCMTWTRGTIVCGK
jgi:hypothetical protein